MVFSLAYVSAYLFHGVPAVQTAAFTVVNLAQVWSLAWLLTRALESTISLTTSREVIWFVVITAFVTGATGFAAGAARSFYYGTPFWTGWLSWWIGDGFAILLVVPAIIAWAIPTHRKVLGVSRAAVIEMTALTLLLIAVADHVFAVVPGSALSPGQFSYLTFPFLLWAAFRFGILGATSGAVLISVVAAWNTIEGRGPFALVDELVGPEVLSLQTFLGIEVVFSLMAAAVTTELRLAKKDVERSNIELESRVGERTAELHRATEELKREAFEKSVLDQRFWTLFEQSQVGLAIVGPDYQLAKTNPAYCTMLGYTEQELKALTFSEITHPDDVEENFRLTDQMFAEGRSAYQTEKRYIRKNGEVIWGNLRATSIRDDDGRILYGLALLEDITERKRAEENIRMVNAKLEASEEQLLALLESAQDGIVVTDREGRILLVNAQTRTMFGYESEELVGQPVELLVPGDRQDSHRASLVAYCADPRMRPMGDGLELRAQRKDGSEFPVEISLSPTRVGEDLMIMAVVRDVTERKRLEWQFHEAQRMDHRTAGGRCRSRLQQHPYDHHRIRLDHLRRASGRIPTPDKCSGTVTGGRAWRNTDPSVAGLQPQTTF